MSAGRKLLAGIVVVSAEGRLLTSLPLLRDRERERERREREKERERERERERESLGFWVCTHHLTAELTFCAG